MSEGSFSEAQWPKVITKGLPNLDPSLTSGHLLVCERGQNFHFKQALDVVSINSSYFSGQAIQKQVEA